MEADWIGAALPLGAILQVFVTGASRKKSVRTVPRTMIYLLYTEWIFLKWIRKLN